MVVRHPTLIITVMAEMAHSCDHDGLLRVPFDYFVFLFLPLAERAVGERGWRRANAAAPVGPAAAVCRRCVGATLFRDDGVAEGWGWRGSEKTPPPLLRATNRRLPDPYPGAPGVVEPVVTPAAL